MWTRSIHILSLLALSLSAVSAANYYVDASQGWDQADGLSETTPWQSLKRLNKVRFAPGDVIHLRAGEVFKGQFRSKDSGSTEELIQLVSYGKGAKPQIVGQGLVESAVLLENVSHWLIEGIEISNMGVEPQANRRGLLLKANGGGVYRNITFRDLTVRDINGSVSKKKGGGTGIRWEVDGRKEPTRIDGLLIENCHLIRCDRDGIKGMMSPWDDLSNLSTNIVIRGNLLEDIGGDGIVPIGTYGALIEYNRLYGMRQRIDNLDTKEVTQYAGPSVGIWPWSCKNTHVRFNEVWNYAGTFDGQGLDSDFNCDGTLFEYNLSAKNAGGFFLICNWSKHQDSGQSIGNSNTTIRHNVSFNDHLRGFVVNGPVENVSIHGNIIYNTIEAQLQLLIDTPWEAGRFAKSVVVSDNLFYTTGVAQIYQATWDGSGMGLWKAQKSINRKTYSFSGNSYTRVEGFNGMEHQESKQLQLSAQETLGSLIGHFDSIPQVRDNFDRMHDFLTHSRYWSLLKAAL
jgi:hypothetical protein